MQENGNKNLLIAWYYAVKDAAKCKNCDEDHPATLEFHHREPSEKVDTISNMVKNNVPLKDILEEAAKCDILCKNCHAKVHFKWSKEAKAQKLELRLVS